MKKSIDYSVIPNFEECLPRITLIIPYNIRRKKKSELNAWLAVEADKIEKDLMQNCPKEKTAPIIKKLRHLIERDLSGRPGKNIGIFVSPSIEEVYYYSPTVSSEIKLPPVLVHKSSAN